MVEALAQQAKPIRDIPKDTQAKARDSATPSPSENPLTPLTMQRQGQPWSGAYAWQRPQSRT